MDIETSQSGRSKRRSRPTRTRAAEGLLQKLPWPSMSGIPTYILCFVVALAPLPYGSYDKRVTAFWCGVLALCAIATALGPIRIDARQSRLLSGIGVLLLGYAFVLHEQMADHPWIAGFHPIWAKASEVLGIQISPSASIVRGEPFFALGPTIANILALVCGLLIGADRARARQIFLVVACSGAMYAIYGIASFLFEPTMLLWREKRYYLGSLTATFVNRNTAAAYFGSCAVIWLILLLEQVRDHLKMRPIAWRHVPSTLVDKPPRSLAVSFGLFFVCLIALFLTASRAGVILSLIALIVTFVLFFRRDLPSRSGLLMALSASAVFALVLLQIFGGVVSSRFDMQGLADEGRLAAYESTLRIIGDFPWFGTGLGTFAWSFPAYRSPDISMNGVWDIVHNTPLELASEVGLPLFGVVAIGWLIIFLVLGGGVARRRRDIVFPLGALSVALIANLHSIVDFSLQIPGYSIVVFGLTGVGLSQSNGRAGLMSK